MQQRCSKNKLTLKEKNINKHTFLRIFLRKTIKHINLDYRYNLHSMVPVEYVNTYDQEKVYFIVLVYDIHS